MHRTRACLPENSHNGASHNGPSLSLSAPAAPDQARNGGFEAGSGAAVRAAAGALAALMEEAIGAMAGHVPLAVRFTWLVVHGTPTLMDVMQEISRSCIWPYQAHFFCSNRIFTIPECRPSCHSQAGLLIWAET